MSVNSRAAEDDRGRTKEAAGRVIGDCDLEEKGLTDQNRAEMKKNLEYAGYTVKDGFAE
jgi:uncharacterized protein YjbJ (UPF0337 family)